MMLRLRLPFWQIGVWLLLAGAGLTCWADYPNPPKGEQALPSVLEQLKVLDTIKDPVYQESPLDPVYRKPEKNTSRKRYQAYLNKVKPLYDFLMFLQQRLELSPRDQMTLQLWAAESQHGVLLYNTVTPQLSEAELQFESFQLMQKAVLSLQEAVAYWKGSNALIPTYRTSEQALGEDSYVIQTRFQGMRVAFDDLKQLRQLYRYLELGQKTAEW
jgi:hypothetical protein